MMGDETAAVAREQLRKLQPKNDPGSKAVAEAKNAKHCASAAAFSTAAAPWQGFPVHRLVGQGRGCPTFRQIVASGLYPPHAL